MKSAPERSAPDRSARTKQETSAGPESSLPQPVPATAGWATAGLSNRALLALHRAGRLQAKSRVGAPGDPREREADRAAEAVVAGAAARPERETRRAPDLAPAHTPGQGEQLVAPLIEPLGRGERLDEAVRSHMETRFGESFEDVRVHTGHHAHEANETLRARAFTVGADIVFGEGQYAPGTTEGRRLLAHELAHVVQQRRSTGAFADNRETERDAHEAAARILEGGTPRVRERAAPGSVQRAPLTDVPADYESGTGWGNSEGTIDWTITADGHPVVKALRVHISTRPSPRAWEDVDTKTLYVDPGTNGPNGLLGNGRWSQVLLTHGRPAITPPSPPSPPPKPPPQPKPKPAPAPKKPAPKPPPQPQPAPSSRFPEIPLPQVVPETVITPEETDSPGVAAEPVAEADSRPVAEQVVTALESDPSKAAQLAPQLADADLEQFTARDRAALLGALAAHAPGALDVATTLRILQSTPRNQYGDLLERLVAHDGKVLADLRAAARPEDRDRLEVALWRIQISLNLASGGNFAGPDLFDPLGARGFAKPLTVGGAPRWARDLRFRREANGDWTIAGPDQPPITVEGLLSRTRRAERQNEQIASSEARNLSPQGKVDRMKQLADHLWTGGGDEERLINLLHYTSADEAALVLEGLKTTQAGGKPLIDRLDEVTDLDNNVLLHAELAALRMRARRNDPKLLTDLAKAPMLPWRDALFHNRAVFVTRKLPDGRIAVTYGALQSFDLEASEAFGAAMRRLPKEMQHGGTLYLDLDDIVIVNDTDGNRQVPLTAADLVAFEHSGDRGLIKHIANVGSVVIPVGLAARGTIGAGQAALEVGGALIALTADEYRMELTKWSPGLMHAIDIANVALAIKGGVDLTRLGASGASAIYGRLKTEYDGFKATRAAAIAASGDAKAIRAAQIADAEARALLLDLEKMEKGVELDLPGPQASASPSAWGGHGGPIIGPTAGWTGELASRWNQFGGGLKRALSRLAAGAEPLPEGAFIQTHDLAVADALVEDLIARSPAREVGVWHNASTGETIVVQGSGDWSGGSVQDFPRQGGPWSMIEHYHPERNFAVPMPSPPDFRHIEYLAKLQQGGTLTQRVSSRIRFRNPRTGEFHFTEYGVDPSIKAPLGPYFVRVQTRSGAWMDLGFGNLQDWNTQLDVFRNKSAGWGSF